jgi:SAM-dependent methyltransferase
MFQKTLKKKLRLKAFKKYLGAMAPDKKYFLVTCGDNNGAMNYYLRELGGEWCWADIEETSIAEMSDLLGEKVVKAEDNHIPFPDNYFDYTLSIDVHEHLEDPQAFSAELQRITKFQGQILITVPGGDKRKLVNVLKEKIGMTRETYSHTRDGYSIAEIKSIMSKANIHPQRSSTFSRLFTELLELGINFLYVKVLARKSRATVNPGTIAPRTEDQLKSVEKSYRIYSLIYPFFWMFSQLDKLLFFTEGYVVIVEGQKIRLN